MKRIVVPSYPHHVIQRGVRSMDIFFEDDDRREYLQLLRQQGEQFGVRFISYCLMTNHVHLIAIPDKPEGLARAVGEAHRRYTRMINFRNNVRGYLFQGRFSSCPVCTGEYLLAAVRYVERNPVRAKMVPQAWDYPWSSAAIHSGVIDHDPLVTESSLLSEITDWKQFLRTESDYTDQLREKSRTGRPLGPESFFTTVEKITGTDARPKSPGRPSIK
ncbi:MAG: transposase [Desulfocapsaceae bacterium]|nr:transposase [Desulfocapsaceae bacterium]